MIPSIWCPASDMQQGLLGSCHDDFSHSAQIATRKAWLISAPSSAELTPLEFLKDLFSRPFNIYMKSQGRLISMNYNANNEQITHSPTLPSHQLKTTPFLIYPRPWLQSAIKWRKVSWSWILVREKEALPRTPHLYNNTLHWRHLSSD